MGRASIGSTRPRRLGSRIRAFRARIAVVAVVSIATSMLSGCWSQFRANQSHTGTMSSEQTLGPGLASKLARSWTAATGGKVESSPAFDANNVYVGSDDGKVYALALQNGSVRWTATTGGAVRSSPAVSSGAVYVGSNDGKLYALSPSTGAPLWTFTTGGAVESSPALDGDAVFVGSDDGKVYALDAASGAQLWSFATAGRVTAAPAVANGLVIVGSHDKTIRALDRATGALVWSVTTGGAVAASASVVNGTAYVVSFDGVVHAIAVGTGTAEWSAPLGTFVDSSTAVDNGTLVVAGEDGGLRALDAGSGALRWNAPLGSGASSSPAIADGVVYVGTRGGRVSALDEVNGRPLWSDTTLGGVLSSPAEQRALVAVGSDDGHVYAYTPAPLCGGAYNTIACENSKPGSPPSQWDVSGNGDPSIQGFATQMSVDHGQTIQFKIQTPASAYHLDIYRMGYYGGNGARLVATVKPSVALPQAQPPCLVVTAPYVNMVDCGDWGVSASWSVPSDAVSGIYFARLVRDDVPGGDASHVFFVVRDDEGRSDILFQTSDATWQAYNDWGPDPAHMSSSYSNFTAKTSYNRPFDNRGSTTVGGQVKSQVFNAEYPLVRWLESNGYDVSYFSSADTDRYGSLLLNHRVFVSAGHDEYWSGGQRANVTAARDAGVNLAFLSGNTGYWKTRWEPSADGTATPYRTLVTYKETEASAKIDPSPAWTGLWRDPRFSPPSDGGRPENTLNGTLLGQEQDATLSVSSSEGRMRLWRDTSLATLAPGATATLTPDTVGYEFDMDTDNGVQPPGVALLSTTTGLFGPHHATLYRAPSGALVFSAATVQWSWGLDAHHD
jgi:outer membrane protein assembly factor BamB